MSGLQRSLKNVQGDVTVNEGDVIITDSTKGLVTEDNTGDLDRINAYDDVGVKTVKVEELP